MEVSNKTNNKEKTKFKTKQKNKKVDKILNIFLKEKNFSKNSPNFMYIK